MSDKGHRSLGKEAVIMRWAQELPDDTLVVCPPNIGGCGKRFSYAEVKHMVKVTKTVRDPETGELLAVHGEATCPTCGTKPLVMPGGSYAPEAPNAFACKKCGKRSMNNDLNQYTTAGVHFVACEHCRARHEVIQIPTGQGDPARFRVGDLLRLQT
jgi:DNA-directed RNA polymerase subunit RPC12/RpoP